MPINRNPEFRKKHKSESPLSRSPDAAVSHSRPSRISLPISVTPPPTCLTDRGNDKSPTNPQEWNRSIPQAGYITLGTLRYGVRLSNPSDYFHSERGGGGEDKHSCLSGSSNVQFLPDHLSNGSSTSDNCCCSGPGLIPPWSNPKPISNGSPYKTKLPVSSAPAKNRPSTLSPSSSSSCTASEAVAVSPNSSLSLINRRSQANVYNRRDFKPPSSSLTVPSTSDLSSTSSVYVRRSQQEANSQNISSSNRKEGDKRVTCFNLNKKVGESSSSSSSTYGLPLCPKGGGGERVWFGVCDPCSQAARSITPDLNDIVILRDLSAASKNGQLVTQQRRCCSSSNEGASTRTPSANYSDKSELVLIPKRLQFNNSDNSCSTYPGNVIVNRKSGGDLNNTQERLKRSCPSKERICFDNGNSAVINSANLRSLRISGEEISASHCQSRPIINCSSVCKEALEAPSRSSSSSSSAVAAQQQLRQLRAQQRSSGSRREGDCGLGGNVPPKRAEKVCQQRQEDSSRISNNNRVLCDNNPSVKSGGDAASGNTEAGGTVGGGGAEESEGGKSSSSKSVDNFEREWENCIKTLSDICNSIESKDISDNNKNSGGNNVQNSNPQNQELELSSQQPREEEEDETMEKRKNTLDRWQRLGFGRRSSSNNDLAEKTKKDKTERLKELTELLRGSRSSTPSRNLRESCSPPPPPIPPPRRQRAMTSAEKSFEGVEPSVERNNENMDPGLKSNMAKPPSIPKPLHISVSSPHFRCLIEERPQKEKPPPEPVQKVVEDFFPLTPPPESKIIVGSYMQKSIPFRSASFSQVDFNSGKYVIGGPNKESVRPNRNSTSVLESSTLPRKRSDLRLLHSMKHNTATVKFEKEGSIAEELPSDELHFNHSPLNTIESVDNEGYSPDVTVSETVPKVETDTSEPVIVKPEEEPEKKDEDLPQTEVQETDETQPENGLLRTASYCVIPTPVFECCGKEIMNENVTEWFELPDINVKEETDKSEKEIHQEREQKKFPNVSITLAGEAPTDTSSSASPQDNPADIPVEVRKRHTLNSDESRDSAFDESGKSGFLPVEERKRIDKSKRRKGIYIQWPVAERNPNISQDSWDSVDFLPTPQSEDSFKKGLRLNVSGLGFHQDTLSTASCEPITPESDSNNNNMPNWPKPGNRRRSITYQSSEEKDDHQSRQKQPMSRSDSTSDNESDQTPPRDRQNSSVTPSDDLRRYSKRPLRGPYGQMLEAEMKKPSKLSYDQVFEDLRNTDFRSNNRRSKGTHSLDESVKNKVPKQRKSSANLPLPSFHERAASTPSQMDHAAMRETIGNSHKKFASSVEKLYYDSSGGGGGKKSSDPEKGVKAAHHPEHAKMCKRSASGFLDRSRVGKRGDKYQLEGSPLRKHNSEIVETPHGPVASADLLADLLKGSSEKQASESATGRISATSALPKAVFRCLDTRTHVVIELFNTEQSYVESLQTLVVKYLNPLKSAENVCQVIDTQVVDEIFYMVPSILSIHERFLGELQKRLETWDSSQKVGDAFIDVFSSNSVIEVYTCFVNNWNKAKTAIRNTCANKPAFARFLETMAREHKGKLSLDNLLIKPVQKFPNYELILSRLIKHTDAEHPDQNLLQDANKLVHNILMHLNCKEKEALENGQREAMLREFEGVIEGITDLVAPDRSFLLFDLVSMFSGQSTRKERGIFLFSDLLVITSIKKRSGTIKKPSTIYTGSVATTLDTNKYKFLTKMSLDDLEIVKAKDESVRKMIKEMEHLSEDCSKLQKIAEVANTIRFPHLTLEDAIKDLQKEVQKQLSDRQSNDTQLSILDLNVISSDINQNMSILFSKPEKRNQWEEAFTLAKQKLATSSEKNTIPEFLLSIPIRKTRAGLQFTCAASTLGSQNDVWVCNSDGYVGQVCVLSLHPEPTVTSCNGVCNARILCVTSVPSYADNSDKGGQGDLNDMSESSKGGGGLSEESKGKSKNGDGGIQLESSSSSDNDSDIEFSAQLNVSTPAKEQHQQSMASAASCTSLSKEDDPDRMQSTMWLGTEDGCIHVYNCTDNIRIKKNKIKIQHICAVYSILYLDNRVFVSLANGDICVYMRDNSVWNTTSPLNLTVGTVTSPVTKLLNVHGKVWCAIQGVIKVLNTQHLQVESQIQISSESKPITNMVASSNSVWVTIQNSSIIKCFHSTSYELLFEINVSNPVNKMLSNCDDIIRQHKAACLRITALLACKDILWIGTSAGVLLTLPVQNLNKSLQQMVPSVVGIPHGHTGHVRFLTCVDCSRRPNQATDTADPKRSGSKTEGVLIISGGDGYEDFRSSNANSANEVAGREDSTNHLLLWQI